MKKIADLNANDLIKGGMVNEELIKKIYRLKFNGIYADMTGIEDKKAAEIIEVMAQAANRYGVDIHNYIVFNNGNIEENIKKIETFKKELEEKAITAVMRFSEEASKNDIVKAVNKLSISNIAIEMPEMKEGDELSEIRGKVSALFLKDTKGLSKDKNARQTRNADKRYNAAYNRALHSDYMLNIAAKNISMLKEYMSAKAEEKKFDEMISAMDRAGITADSVVYQYVMDRKAENTQESYAAAKGYLRAAVENYLEREYVKVKEIAKEAYIKGVRVSERNVMRALMLYMAVNGEEITAENIKAIFESQKLALGAEERSMTELMEEVNGLINEITKDPLNAPSEKKEEAKRAFTLMNDSIAGLAIDRMIENTKTGANLSITAVKGFLQAA
jgi:hypothetical protein